MRTEKNQVVCLCDVVEASSAWDSETFFPLKSYLFLCLRYLHLLQWAVAWFLDHVDKLILGLHQGIVQPSHLLLLTILKYSCNHENNFYLTIFVYFNRILRDPRHNINLQFSFQIPSSNSFLVSKETEVVPWWESETKIWFYQTS